MLNKQTGGDILKCPTNEKCVLRLQLRLAGEELLQCQEVSMEHIDSVLRAEDPVALDCPEKERIDSFLDLLQEDLQIVHRELDLDPAVIHAVIA